MHNMASNIVKWLKTPLEKSELRSNISVIKTTLNDIQHLWERCIWHVLWFFFLSPILMWRGRNFWPVMQPANRGQSWCFGFTFRELPCHPCHLYSLSSLKETGNCDRKTCLGNVNIRLFWEQTVVVLSQILVSLFPKALSMLPMQILTQCL